MQASPLQWPFGRPRTHYPARSQFKNPTLGQARDRLLHEIELLGGADVVISSDLKLRQDGLPLASQRAPQDKGAAVYFTHRKKPVCFACDQWDRIEDNIHAIALTIQALRGIERWGSGDMMDRAFSGFTALPPPAEAKRPWRIVLNFSSGSSPDRDDIEHQYRILAKRRHPDAGGSAKEFAELQDARDEALREIGL